MVDEAKVGPIWYRLYHVLHYFVIAVGSTHTLWPLHCRGPVGI